MPQPLSDPPVATGEQPRIGSVEGLRVLAALGILVAHVTFITGFNARSSWGIYTSRLDVGVSVFFVMAGFLIYRPFAAAHLAGTATPDLLRWARRRFLRIVPAYWLVLLVALGVTASTNTPKEILAFFGLMQTYWPRKLPTAMEQSWSLCVEVAFYLFLPIWSKGLRRIGGSTERSRLRREIVGLSVLAVAAPVWRGVMLAADWNRFYVLNWLPAFFDVFAAGMGLAVAVEWRKLRSAQTGERDRGLTVRGADDLGLVVGWGAAILAFVAVAHAGIPAAGFNYTDTDNHVRHLLYAVVAVGVVAPVALRRTPARGWSPLRLLQSKPMVWLGMVSYGIYLWQGVVAELLFQNYPASYFRGPFFVGPTAAMLWWTVVISVGLAVVTFVFVEWPGLLVGHGRREAAGEPGQPAAVRLPWLPEPHHLGLAGITAAGFAWRLITLTGLAARNPDGGDPLYYHVQANLLAAGKGFAEPYTWLREGRVVPAVVHPPLYSLYLSVYSKLFSATDFLDHKLASVLAGTAIVLVAGLLGTRLAGRRVGLIAAALAAASPNLWLIDGTLFAEGLYVALVGGLLLAGYRWRDRPGWRRAVLLGAVLGLSILARGEAVFLALVLVCPWMLLRRGIPLRRRLRDLALTTAVAGAVIAPWMVRNLVSFEDFVPLSTNSVELIMYANCSDTYFGDAQGQLLGSWSFNCQQRVRAAKGEPPGDESQRATAWRDMGIRYARAHLGRVPAVLGMRFLRTWELFRPIENTRLAAVDGRNLSAARFALATYYPLMLAAIVGVVIGVRRRLEIGPLLALPAAVTIIVLYSYGSVRFRASAELSIVVLAAIALGALWDAAERRYGSLVWASVPGRVGAARAFITGTRPVAGIRSPRREVAKAETGRPRGAWLRRRLADWRSWVAFAALGLFIALPVAVQFRSPGSPMEEGFMLVFPDRLLRGDVPNVDFLHLYGPASLQVLAAVYRVFGVSLDVQRVVGLAQHLGIITGVVAVARPWGRRVAVVCGGVATMLTLFPVGLTALAWSGAVALGLWAMVLAARATAPAGAPGDTADGSSPGGVRGRTLAAAGVLAGLALAYRPDLVVAVTLGGAVALWGRSWRDLRPAFVGGLVGLLPMWVHLGMAGPARALNGMLLDPVFRLREGRTLPMPPAWDRIDGQLQRIAELIPPSWPLPAPGTSKEVVLFFVLVPLSALTLLVGAVLLVRRHGDEPRSRALLVAAAFGLGLLPQALQRPDTTHFAWVSCVSMSLVPVVLYEMVSRWFPRWRQGLRVATVAGIVGVVLTGTIPFFTVRTWVHRTMESLGGDRFGVNVVRGDRSFVVGDTNQGLASRELIADLDPLITPGQRLIVGTTDLRLTPYVDDYFYHLFPDLVPGTYYIEMDPGMANRADSGLADEVANADYLILNRLWLAWDEPNTSTVPGSDAPNEVIRRDFCLVNRYRGILELYRRCDR